MTEATQSGTCPHFPFSNGRPVELEPEYIEFRRDKPVARVELPYGGEAWLLTRMAEVKEFLGDTRFSRQAMKGLSPRYTEAPIADEGGLPMMDGAQHLRTRRLLNKAFSRRRVETLRPAVTTIVNDLVDAMEAGERPVDLVAEFGNAIPREVNCLLLGVPSEDWTRLGRLVDDVIHQGVIPQEQLIASWTELTGYFMTMIKDRRLTPTEDLISEMLQARNGEDAFTDEEVMMNAVVVFVAGYETTACQIVNMICALLRDTEQLEWLRDNPDALPQAVEELLRYVPLTAAGVMPSVAVEDAEIGGVPIAAGEAVYTCVVSANRDEEVFTEPEKLDLRRGNEVNQHVAFGAGPHYCLGASLARVELQVALEAVLRRMPALRLAVPEAELPLKNGLVLRGFEQFPVVW
ncbi:cytochrome P450 [Streptomyces qinzhouensis]|uniref:Cytochrome P450 n=1 Tax=Streptomyces qinzhouensis TaxID=2599401 RepID=A0A5B8JQS8_9ACTN|nr:cytochrome P450 [Streptomyces qinzhouensis]QDY80073.1 cytochrome P450 [Streptomyces qinzhouensis]